jgi:primary-amine oxidase
MRFRSALLLGLGLPALLLVIAGAFGQQRSDPPDGQLTSAVEQGGKGKEQPRIVEQSFPPNGMPETSWKVEWTTQSGYGLIIKNAWFKRSPDHAWMQVLGDARVSEIFVPYHRGSPRFWDVSYGFHLSKVSAEDAGPHGKIHVSSDGSSNVPCVVEELKDRGVIWKSNAGVRRGHVLLLWGCLDAANYRYIMEYGFQDDGTITFRLGSTGHNYSGSEWDPHMHNALWRIQVNVDGPHNTVYLMEREELANNDGKATSVHTLFNKGVEGYADWDPKRFTMLRVANENKKNAEGKFYAYDLMPLRQGTPRHFAGNREEKEEDCTQHDFWVTKANSKELNYKEVMKYVENKEKIVNTDVVLWYMSPSFHEPRTEDGIVGDHVTGCTHVAWSMVTLRPTNIFDRTPLFNYPDKGKKKGKG